MKLKVDQQADALYLTLGKAPASRSEEVSPGIIVDYDEQDRVVGIEMLYLSKRVPEADIHRFSGSQRERETREDYDAGVERYRTALRATERMLAQTRAAQDQDK